jgi:hypothetical protein
MVGKEYIESPTLAGNSNDLSVQNNSRYLRLSE